MKTDSTKKDNSSGPGVALLVKLVCMLVVVPVVVPAIAFSMQAFVWCCLLNHIEGIDFIGGFKEAFALSLALVGFSFLVNTLVGSLAKRLSKWRGLPEEKPATGKVSEISTWDDMFKSLPGIRSVLLQITATTLGLAMASAIQPGHIHFQGVLQMILAAAVLSATWNFFFLPINVALHALLMHEQKAAVDARKKAARV